MNLYKTEPIDLAATPDDHVEVEIQKELGFTDRYKLYVHVNGTTVLRICKLQENQIHALVNRVLVNITYFDFDHKSKKGA